MGHSSGGPLTSRVMAFRMLVDLSVYDKAVIETLFAPIVSSVNIAGIDGFLAAVGKSAVGISAVQVAKGSRARVRVAMDADDLTLLPGELVAFFLHKYVKPVVSAPELQYLFPAAAGNSEANFNTLAMLLGESGARVPGWQPLTISKMEHTLYLSDIVTDHTVSGLELHEPGNLENPEWRRIEIDLEGDSKFHQMAGAWANLIVPDIIYAVYKQDASQQARKRRLEVEEEESIKRARVSASAGGAAAAGGPVVPPVPVHVVVQPSDDDAQRRREATERGEVKPDRVDSVLDSTVAATHLSAAFAGKDPINDRLDATLALNSSVQDYAKLQRVVMIGTQGSNSRGDSGKEIRMQSDAYEQRIADFLQSVVIKTAITKLQLVQPLARRIRRHDFKLFLGAAADMNILFRFDDGTVKELKASEQLTTVYIPRVMRIFSLLGHDVTTMQENLITRVDYLYDNMRVACCLRII